MKLRELQKTIRRYKLEHRWFRWLVEYGLGTIICALSAFALSIAINSFVAPNQSLVINSGGQIILPRIIAGGANGFSQVIVKIAQLFGVNEDISRIIQPIIYGVINIPLIIIAFLKIGKKFTFFSMLNVALSTIFMSFIPGEFYDRIAVIFSGQIIPRVIFGGALVGFSSGIAYRFGQSAGGIDIVGHILASRKSALTGKYSFAINAAIMGLFIILCMVQPDQGQKYAMLGYAESLDSTYTLPLITDMASYVPTFVERLSFLLIIALSSLFYLLTSAFVVDIINLRNKKEQIQIITTNQELPGILLRSFHHGVTTTSGRGEYTKENKIVVYMTVSYYETTEIIEHIREIDPEAFTNVTSLRQVYGRFFIPPIK